MFFFFFSLKSRDTVKVPIKKALISGLFWLRVKEFPVLTLGIRRYFVFQKCFEFHLDGICVTEVLGTKKVGWQIS